MLIRVENFRTIQSKFYFLFLSKRLNIIPSYMPYTCVNAQTHTHIQKHTFFFALPFPRVLILFVFCLFFPRSRLTL